MKQSRLASFLDTIGGTLVGFVVALAVQYGVAVWFDLPLRMLDNAAIVVVFTVVSIVRGYAWRRVMETLHARRPLSPFMQAVIAERFRQPEVEGFDAAHDDGLDRAELARGGAAYAVAAAADSVPSLGAIAAGLWPFRDPMKVYSFRRDLVKAGAMILAEGERHDRNRKKGQP